MLWTLLLFANGTVLMLFNGTAAGPLVNLTLPSPAAVPPVVELNGIPVPALYGGSWVAVPAARGAAVTVRYVPQVGQRGPLLTINITTPDAVLVWAEGGLLITPQNVINYTTADGGLLILMKGPGTIAYTIPKPPQTNPQATQPQTAATPIPTAKTPPQPPTPTPQPPTSPQPLTATASPASEASLMPWAAAAALAATAAAAGLALWRRRRAPQAAAGLSEVDTAVLSYVRSRGGAYEAEVARALNIPRTTVYRAVRRLEELGYVRVDKRDGRNWIEPTR